MTSFLQDIWAGLTTWSLDQANLLLGITGVWLMIRRNLWAFPVGLLAVTVQGVLFWQIQLYAEAKIQVFFFGGLAYGWWHWVRHKGSAPELPITTLPGKTLALCALAGLVGAVLWAEYLRRHTTAIAPYRDAFLASFSVVAQLLQARKKIENWPVWIAVNTAAVVVYFQLGLAYTAFLYAVYLGLAFVGWREWHRARRAQPAPPSAPASSA